MLRRFFQLLAVLAPLGAFALALQPVQQRLYAGTGQRDFEKIIVGSKEEYERILANRKNVLDYSEVE